jgi:hypothetical protein
MTSTNQGKQTSARKRYLILGMVILGLLIGGLMIRFQGARTGNNFPTSTSSFGTLQINVPMTEYPTIPPSAPEFMVPIQDIGNSGISGTVTFKDIAGSVAILLHVDGVPGDEESEESIMPAELRYGTCANPGALAYPMSPPDAGESETDLSINLKQFNTQKPMAVFLYRSLQDHTAIACGAIQ